MLVRKDRDTLIEQSATLIEQSTTISLKTLGSYFNNTVKKCLKYTLELLKCEIFSGGKPQAPINTICVGPPTL